MSHSTITLLSDLGTRDASVTIAKAAFMQYAPEAVIIDISHNVVQYDLQQAAYLLLSAYRHFQKGTIHVLLVDVFGGGDIPCMLVAEKDEHFFIAPDNGILPLTFGNEMTRTWLWHELQQPFAFSEWIKHTGLAINALQTRNTTSFTPYEIKKGTKRIQHSAMAGSMDCNIQYIDRYGNVVLDITRGQFDTLVQNRPFKIKVMRMDDITTISRSYNDVAEGDALCRFNEAGFLEIALNHAPAATLLGLGVNSPGNLHYQTIKIFF